MKDLLICDNLFMLAARKNYADVSIDVITEES